MQSWSEITHYAGFDWATDHHDVVIVNRSGKIVADFQIEHTAEGWQRWGEQVAALGAGLAACVETSQGFVVEQLLESGVAVYPISPASAKAYRQRKVPSGNKTDHVDAWSLADALRVDGHGWKALAKEDPLVAELRLLCRDEVALIQERTALINQLQSALREYYPAALEAFEDWTHCRARGPSWKPSPPRRLWHRLANASGRSSSTLSNWRDPRPIKSGWKSLRVPPSWSPAKPLLVPRVGWLLRA